ncbi:MAG TPA: tetratricopeptide repeat protein [Flavisolibacter sp.]
MSVPFHRLPFVFFILTLGLSPKVQGQSVASTAEEWEPQLASRNDNDNNAFRLITATMHKKDSAFVFSVLSLLDNTASRNHYFTTRLYCLKADQLSRLSFDNSRALVVQYFDKALTEAYRSSDDHLISFVCQLYARVMYDYQELAQSITYYLKAAEIEDKLNQKVTGPYFVWFRLGVALFHIREFQKSIYYIKKGLDRWTDTSASAQQFRISYLNTIGQDYHQLGLFDSALATYAKSNDIAMKTNDQGWLAINSSFMAQAYFQLKEYEKAKPLLVQSYRVTKDFDLNITANTLQWLSRIFLIEGKKDSASLVLREAFQLLGRSNSFPLQNREFTELAYLSMANTFRAMGNTDSFYRYFQLYSSLHDSLQYVVDHSSLEISQLRIVNENNYQTIQSLERQKKNQLLIRNLFITAVVLLSIIGLMYTNRQKIKYRHREEIAVKEKQAAQLEIASARQQLQLITESVLEKNNLVEKLSDQLQSQNLHADQYKMIDELSSLTILTEDEWSKFKTLFEKVYPGFFLRLKAKAPDITIAEQRTAALTRLHLTSKEMAAMLGISVDSVHKAKQRLRQRLDISTELNLEQSINSF